MCRALVLSVAVSVGAVCVGARRSVSGPGAPSSCRGPALLASGPGALCRGSARVPAVCVLGLALSVCLSKPNRVCVEPGLFLYRSSALLCQGPALSGGLSVSGCVWGPCDPWWCRRLGRCFCEGPGALCVGARRSLRRGPALIASAAPCWGPVLSVESVPGFGGPLPRLPLSRPVFVPGPSAFCRGLCPLAALGPALCGGPGALCVGARRSVWGPALFVSGAGALCRGPALFVSGPGALCVGARRSFYRAPALSVRVCLEPGLFLHQNSALQALCVGARRSPAVSESVSLLLSG